MSQNLEHRIMEICGSSMYDDEKFQKRRDFLKKRMKVKGRR